MEKRDLLLRRCSKETRVIKIPQCGVCKFEGDFELKVSVIIPWKLICPICVNGENKRLAQQKREEVSKRTPLENYLIASKTKEKAVNKIFSQAFKIKFTPKKEVIENVRIEEKPSADTRMDRWWVSTIPIPRVNGTGRVMERFKGFGGHYYLNEEEKNTISLSDLRTYQGKKREVTARWLETNFSNRGDVVLDPFSGSGMLSLVGKSIGRKPIAFDILRAAERSTKALINTPERGEILRYASHIAAVARDVEIDTNDYPLSVKKWYDTESFKEVIKFYEVVDKEMVQGLQDDERMKNFQMQIVIYLLSRVSYGRGGYSWKIAEKEFRKRQLWDKDLGEEYIRHAKKVTRSRQVSLYDTQFPTYRQSILERTPLEDGSVDRIITDPPYGNMINYMAQTWVDEYFLGWKDIVTMDELLGVSACPQKGLDFMHKHMIQDVKTFFERMEIAMKEMYRLLRSDGSLTFIIGDFKEPVIRNKKTVMKKINPFRPLEKIGRRIGFEAVYCIDKPFTRQSTYKHTHTGEQKYERIIIFRKGVKDDDILTDREIEEDMVGLDKWL